MAKQVFDLRPGKGMTLSQSNEHLRNYSMTAYEAKKTGNFDPTREKLNFEVGRGGIIMPLNKKKSITQRIKDILAERGIKDPNEKFTNEQLELKNVGRRTVANIILGGSREQMIKLAFGNQNVNLEHGADNSNIKRCREIEQWAIDMYQFMAKKFGEKNIAAFIVHLDEKNPHVHCTLLPITEKNKFSWKSIFSSKNKHDGSDFFKMIHDEIAEVNAKWNLERGDDITITGAKHRSTEEYWMWLKKTCDELERQINGKKETLDFLNKEIHRAEIRVKGLSTMVKNLENKREDIERDIKRRQRRLDEGNSNNSILKNEIDILQKQLNEVNGKLQDKRDKLKDAEIQLDELAGRKASLQKKYDELNTIVNVSENKMKENTYRVFRNIGWQLGVADCLYRINKVKDSYESFSPEEKKAFDKFYDMTFDGSIIENIAQMGNEITAVATALFLGYIDQATSYAVSHGGGGGETDGNWGRDKDDDDETWKRKCFLQANKMMRPSSKRIKR